jgi:hypothetical protein
MNEKERDCFTEPKGPEAIAINVPVVNVHRRVIAEGVHYQAV